MEDGPPKDSPFEILSYLVQSEHNTLNKHRAAEAIIRVKIGDKTEFVVSEGNGPVNALDLALRNALEPHFKVLREVHLVDYWVRVVDGKKGTAARVEVLVFTSNGGDPWVTTGIATDIIEASLQALVKSFTKAIKEQENNPH